MSLSQELLQHAMQLLPDPKDQSPQDVHLRRAVSAAYYSLFHRINADYDLSYQLTWREARLSVELAKRALEAWVRIATSAEANIFILSLLMWKNWEKDR